MKYPLIIFDLDGTIIDDTVYIWKTMHEHFQTDPSRRKQAYEDYMSGKISYAEWAAIDIELLGAQDVTRKDLVDLFQELRLMPNARSTLETLKKRGHELAIISGSVDLVLAIVLPDYKDIFSEVFVNKLIFDQNDFLVDILPTPFDMEHKATGLKFLANQYKITEEDIAFVGDNENDIQIAQIAGLAVAFNSKSERLDSVSQVVIGGKDLSRILKVMQ